ASTMRNFKVLLEQRFTPWCEENRKTLADFDKPAVVEEFFLSWRNLTTGKDGKPLGDRNPIEDGKPLEDSSKKNSIEQFRQFLSWCVKPRGWLTENHAKDIKVTVEDERQYGMEPDEEKAFFKAVNSEKLRVFCLVMRWAG